MDAWVTAATLLLAALTWCMLELAQWLRPRR